MFFDDLAASCSIVAVQSDRDSRGFSFSPHKHECDSPENVNAKWDSGRSLISTIWCHVMSLWGRFRTTFKFFREFWINTCNWAVGIETGEISMTDYKMDQVDVTLSCFQDRNLLLQGPAKNMSWSIWSQYKRTSIHTVIQVYYHGFWFHSFHLHREMPIWLWYNQCIM